MPSETPKPPPFRADHVGSLLRPEALKQARERLLGAHTAENNLGPHHNAELAELEDGFIREAIAMQQRVGLKAVTDGEFRRRSFLLEPFLAWEGITATRRGGGPLMWRNETGATQEMTEFHLTGPIRWQPGTLVPAFAFLKANAAVMPKVTLPAPNLVHYFLTDGGRLDPAIYRDVDEFWADLLTAFRAELKALVEAGATYIQLDDVSFAYLCDPVHREHVQARGYDPDALLQTYADKINEAVAGLPSHVTVALHTCRGNREGHWVAEGAYDPVADALFNRIGVHGYFLEYDTARAGGFEPLRYLPAGKIAVLGLISTKRPELEDTDILLRRIDEASRFADLGQLAIAPQCGFASSYKGNPLTEAEEEAKLRRLVEVADRVWGGV